MLPKVKEALLELRSFQTNRGIKCEVSVDGYSDFIFLNRFNHLYEQGSLNKAIKRIARDCNYAQIDKRKGEETVLLLPRFSNHSLRHTFTTRMCENQVSIKAIQDILGHADAQTTLQIYATATKELKEQAMIEFDEFYRKNQYKSEFTEVVMIIDFYEYQEIKMPCMNDGIGMMTVKMYNDDNYRIIPTRIHKGGSIGLHTQNSGDDLNYIISGTGKAICNGVEEELKAGVMHICPKGSNHTIINTGNDDLVMMTIVVAK